MYLQTIKITWFSNSQDNGINLTHIESRPAYGKSTHFEFYVDCTGTKETLDPVLKKLEEKAEKVQVVAGDDQGGMVVFIYPSKDDFF